MNLTAILDRIARLPRTQRVLCRRRHLRAHDRRLVVPALQPGALGHRQLEQQSHDLQEQKKTVEKRAFDRSRFEAELSQLMAELQQALQELPNEREIPDLLKGISNLGKQVGLEVKSFQPLPEKELGDGTAEVPVALSVEGSFHEVAMFFDRLSKMNRIVPCATSTWGIRTSRAARSCSPSPGRGDLPVPQPGDDAGRRRQVEAQEAEVIAVLFLGASHRGAIRSRSSSEATTRPGSPPAAPAPLPLSRDRHAEAPQEEIFRVQPDRQSAIRPHVLTKENEDENGPAAHRSAEVRHRPVRARRESSGGTSGHGTRAGPDRRRAS
jgi:type IV pilus assembly protein PilO